jgi:hypothetical protein
MAPSSCSIGCLSLGGAVAIKDEWRKDRDELNKDDEAMTFLHLLMEGIFEEDELRHKLHKMSKGKLSRGIIDLFIHLCAHGETIAELKEILDISRSDNVNASIPCKSSLPLSRESCDALLVKMRI